MSSSPLTIGDFAYRDGEDSQQHTEPSAAVQLPVPRTGGDGASVRHGFYPYMPDDAMSEIADTVSYSSRMSSSIAGSRRTSVIGIYNLIFVIWC